jgi:hypothetical protein
MSHRARTTLVSLTLLMTLAMGCGGAESDIGTSEPIRVRNAQIRHGALPGALPSDGGVASSPTVTSVTLAPSKLWIGAEGASLIGRTSGDAVAIAVAFLDLGNAYWVAPLGAPSSTSPGELDWSLTADFGRDIPPGVHTLAFAGVDANGVAGAIRTLSVCFAPDIPDNGYVCAPNVAGNVLPDTVITLRWDTEVDLDLVVVTPEGKVVSPKHPSTAAVDGGAIPDPVLADPSTGYLTRDSNGGCVIDGLRLESLVFDGPPPPGAYRVYARFVSPCHASDVAYESDVYRSSPDGSGGTVLARTERVRGELLSLQANGGTTLGTFVTEITFP